MTIAERQLLDAILLYTATPHRNNPTADMDWKAVEMAAEVVRSAARKPRAPRWLMDECGYIFLVSDPTVMLAAGYGQRDKVLRIRNGGD